MSDNESTDVEDTSRSNGHVVKPTPTAQDLLQRCQTLLSELEDFKEYLKGKRQDHTVEIAHFRNTVKSEYRTLERLASVQAEKVDATQHTVNSSNLPFLETVWNTVKHTTGLQALQKRFYWTEGGGKVKLGRGIRNNKKHQSALVDIVADDGREWIKVSLLTNTRLLFDKAKQGWEDASSSSDSDSDSDAGSSSSTSSESNDVPLVKMSKDLLQASHHTKIRTKHPTITLVLPKLQEGIEPAIDAIINNLRSLDIKILSSKACPPPVTLDSVMTTLLTSPYACLTPTLNIDCTILLALVSDFSHAKVHSEPWFHRALARQVELEEDENLLPMVLYPALENRTLTCTSEAAKRMREIVSTIGTPEEKLRTEIFMGPATTTSASQTGSETYHEVESKTEAQTPHKALESHSRFPVPTTLRLPILTRTATTSSPALPPSAEKVKASLSNINKSVFLHGWAKGATTVTSNRTVVKQIETILGEEAQSDGEWPGIWLCPTARSLVGKEKGRRE